MENFTTEQIAVELVTRAVVDRRFMTAYGALVFGGMTAIAGHSGLTVFIVGAVAAWLHGKLPGFTASHVRRRMTRIG